MYESNPSRLLTMGNLIRISLAIGQVTSTGRTYWISGGPAVFDGWDCGVLLSGRPAHRPAPTPSSRHSAPAVHSSQRLRRLGLGSLGFSGAGRIASMVDAVVCSPRFMA